MCARVCFRLLFTVVRSYVHELTDDFEQKLDEDKAVRQGLDDDKTEKAPFPRRLAHAKTRSVSCPKISLSLSLSRSLSLSLSLSLGKSGRTRAGGLCVGSAVFRGGLRRSVRIQNTESREIASETPLLSFQRTFHQNDSPDGCSMECVI